MKNKEGFTLIELLIVVAIIGIFATIILAALGSARIKTKDAAVLVTMNNMHRQVEIEYSGTYTTLCTDAGSVYDKFEAAVELHGGKIDLCAATANDYRLVAILPSSLVKTVSKTAYAAGEDAFCINSLGTSQRVVLDEVNTLVSPACNAGEEVAMVFSGHNYRDVIYGGYEYPSAERGYCDRVCLDNTTNLPIPLVNCEVPNPPWSCR